MCPFEEINNSLERIELLLKSIDNWLKKITDPAPVQEDETVHFVRSSMIPEMITLKLIREDKYSMTFSIDPRCMGFKPRAPRKGPALTEDQKEANKKRLENLRKTKENEHYLKLKKKRPDQAEQYRLRGWKSVTIRPHDLRHSFCEWCITNGVDPKTVSSWMGHSDQKMIMQVYDHVTNERETKAVEKLNALFPQRSEEN